MLGDTRAKCCMLVAIVILVNIAGSTLASDQTFCVMQHTGYFNLSGGQITFWNGTRTNSNSEPEFAFITVTVAQLTSAMACGGAMTGGVCIDLAGAAAAPSVQLEWVDMSGRTVSMGPVAIWGNSYTFYARWARLSGTGQGFYTITFNPCGGR